MLKHHSQMLFAAALAAGLFVAVNPAQSGDILRGGAAAQPPGAVPVYGATAATTTVARQNANDTLARTTQALQSLRAMQNAARAISAGQSNLGADPNHTGLQLPNVPNGLVTGGLVPDSGLSSSGVSNPVTTWTGANTPTQQTSGAQVTVNVKQTAQQALLNWTTFNIGSNTTLNIDQSGGGASVSQWVAFNKINDPSGIPSQILGSIKAQGQVYVINQNGIIFGGASTVNVHTLVATALPINDNLVSLGLLNNADEQFLFSQLPISTGANGTPAFNPVAPNTPSGRDGDVTVQAGAQITAPTDADHVGGRVALIGPNVTNAGTISTPDGQTILAAGNQVGMAAHASNDPSLRGLDVYVGSVDAFSGNATNTGIIEADRGAITITGKSINQLGALYSTTSVSLNGRIDLLADYNSTSSGGAQNVQPFLPQSAGSVTLGNGSVTQILPEYDSTDRVVGTQLALSSLINIQAETIHMAQNSTLFAPGAGLPSDTTQPALGIDGFALNAGVTLNAGVWILSTAGAFQQYSFVHSNGQVYLDSGAVVDVAGSTDVSASVTENIVSAQLRGAELANSPLQRDGVLRGATVNVDILQTGIYNGQTWVGTPLANLSGYAALVERTVGELTANGGSVSISAGNSVVLQSGATVNVSGGWVNYTGGMVQTTKVVSGGHIYDISQATPNLVYDGILGSFTVDHAKWGVSETFDTVLLGGAYYQAGYTQGGNGGSVTITAPSMALDGNLVGNTYSGARQRAVAAGASALTLTFQAQDTTPTSFLPISPTPPKIIFTSGSSLPAVGAFAISGSGDPVSLSTDRQQEVILSPDLLTTDGFGALTVNNGDGDIVVPANVTLATQAGGSITLSAANIDIEGKIIAPSGALKFTVYDISPYTVVLSTPPADPTRGQFTLGSGAALSTAGLLVNDTQGSPTQNTLPLVNNTNGGTVVINSYNVTLTPGSLINVSGGADVTGNSKGSVATTYGSGGSITVTSGQDPNLPSVLGGQLVLGSTLMGYAGGKGGTLNLQTSLIQIGGVATNPGTLLLTPDFFNQGGFASFGLTGIGQATGTPFEYVPAIEIAPGTVIAPQVENVVAVASGGGYVFTPVLQPAGVRTAASFTFNAKGASDQFNIVDPLLVRGDFVMGLGAKIVTDPQTDSTRGVTINGQSVAILGSVIAPGGSISVKGASDTSALFANNGESVPSVDLGPQSLLSTAGVLLLTPDPTGNNYRTGSVLPGGSISIGGNIVAESGAVIDVSGATGILDLLEAASGQDTTISLSSRGIPRVATRVDSNGGSITLAGAQELFTDATLRGAAGGPSAIGGSLTVSSGFNVTTGSAPLSPNLVVTQSGPVIPAPFYSSGQTAIGHAVVDGSSNIIPGLGYFAVDSFENSGMSSLTMSGVVRFSGPVNITASRSISAASGGMIIADSDVTMTAPYVALGMPFQPPLQASQQPTSVFQIGSSPYYFMPTFGAGSLTVNANLIDIGNLSLQGIGKANFNAINGDIRGNGTLDVAGDITMVAGQIYPTTESLFTIAAYDHSGTSGSVTFAGSGLRQLPLSAGGTMNVYGSIINQGGVLRSPIGTINLGWDGSGAAPIDYITGSGLVDSNGNPVSANKAATTKQLTLSNGSVTSVSAIDPITGKGVSIPYGINLNGTQWIDPAGNDITTSGPPAKTITVSGQSVDDQAGATIDLQGGGDLYAYRFVSGTGGSTDILASSTSFAIIPGYQSSYAPYAPYNSNPVSGNLNGDSGYVNSTLHAGDSIYLAGGNGLAAGYYTLLPARYALMPGAYLVTPSSAQVTSSAVANPDGSVIMSGYRLALGQSGPQVHQSYEVDSQAVIQARAEYDSFSANNYLSNVAATNGVTAPRLPMDAGQLVLAATQSMSILGTFHTAQQPGGRGSTVDIDSSVDILINSTGVDNSFNGLVLDASNLTAIGAESLLIGGFRTTTSAGTTVTVDTNNITLDNQGTPLEGSDVILAANQNLTLAPGAVIDSTGALTGATTLFLGNSSVAGSGNGTLLRVSSDPNALISRVGVSSSTAQNMVIGAGASITGASVTLDSTYGTSLDPSAVVSGHSINLDSGQILIQLDNPGTVTPIAGLMLSGGALQNLQSSASALSLLSYSSIDIYGTGEVGGAADASGNFPVESLALHAGEIRGFNNAGTVIFNAQNILLDNSPVGTAPSRALPSTTTAGTALVFNAGVIRLGASQMNVDQYSAQLGAQAGSQAANNQFNLNQNIDQYDQVTLNASGGVLAQGTIITPVTQSLQGAIVTNVLNTQGGITINTPLITGVTASHQLISSAGAFTIASVPGTATVSGGLGANIALQGKSVTTTGNIVLPSGMLKLTATGGDLNVNGGLLDVGGTAKVFFDLIQYTSGGQVTLASNTGAVNVTAGTINVSAQPGAGDAGTLAISAPSGSFSSQAGVVLSGSGGANGKNGTFTLDAGNIATGSLGALAGELSSGGFTESVSIRDRNDASITVDGVVKAHSFTLSSDKGSILVTGTIDASGVTGGTIDLVAQKNLILQGGSQLSVVGNYYDDAGKGGSITLEAGAETGGTTAVAVMSGGTFSGNGYMDIQAGSDMELGVLHQLTTSDLSLGYTTDNRADLFAGTLHLRAPRITSGTDLQINPINGTVNGASSITVEGNKVYTATGGTISTTVQNTIMTDGNTFAGAKGTTTAAYTAMVNRLFNTNPNAVAMKSISLIEPGAEIVSTTGNLTLPASWDLSTFRFGPNSAAGDLTLRAAGNLIFTFKASLSDGFGGSSSFGLWDKQLLAAGSQSWSYRLIAGADFTAADFRQVKPLSSLASGTGSLLLGNGASALSLNNATQRSTIIPNFYQTIRTGIGSIDIVTGRDVQLLNPLATIYTAGAQAPAINFDTPNLFYSDTSFTTQNPIYPALFSMAGGNVTIAAQNDIVHQIVSGTTITADSSKELPDNWLYRQGWIDPTTGQFGSAQGDGRITSTAWWVDYSNFFEGVGTLGGGNTTLVAGHNVTNVDAVVPTNARMPKDATNASAMVELGGGDLLVKAGNNINGGVYYVERGVGTLTAGGSIVTNSTRATINQQTTQTNTTRKTIPDPTLWMPTTLFLGKGDFDVSAGGDLLLGQVANPFLLPQGINNSFLEKTYFSTYAASDSVTVTSLTGDVSIKGVADSSAGSLLSWFNNMDLTFQNANSFASRSQPWLRSVETAVPSANAFSVMPPTLDATAFSGDINLIGTLNLSPSPTGNVSLAAAGSVNGVQPNGSNSADKHTEWASSLINLSDASPNNIPGIMNPASLKANSQQILWTSTDLSVLAPFDILFNDSGSTEGNFGVIQTKQALHAPGILHLNDTDPIHIYAGDGDVSGITLYAGKFAKVIAGQDITDVALYVENDNASDVTIIAAGRDIIAYDPNSTLRTLAQTGANELFSFVNGVTTPASGSPTAGDIQISGPGSLEVLAGRNLDLGVGPNNADGTGVGLTSIGNAANPYLPFTGANIIGGAGLGVSAGMDQSQMDFTSFDNLFLNPATSAAQSSRYLPDLAVFMGMPGADSAQVWTAFQNLTPQQQSIYSLDIFYLVLRDAGRDHNDSSSAGFGNYDAGYKAIAALFPGNTLHGDISLTSREIKTKSGGDISLFAPGGQLNVGLQVAGTQALDQGILTEDGGSINIFTRNNVNVGTSRIFTLRGGNEIIWSSYGNIAAGASSKTVQSAPPTRVLVDPQSGNVQTDLAGLATGGGIGVLATVVGVPVGDVDLIAPSGVVDAGDAGIRSSGNLNIAAAQILNASNIQVSGASTGTPAAAAAPNVAGLTAGANQAGAAAAAATDAVNNHTPSSNGPTADSSPSDITVEVVGYGGGDGSAQTSPEDNHQESGKKPRNAKGNPPVPANDGGLAMAGEG